MLAATDLVNRRMPARTRETRRKVTGTLARPPVVSTISSFTDNVITKSYKIVQFFKDYVNLFVFFSLTCFFNFVISYTEVSK